MDKLQLSDGWKLAKNSFHGERWELSKSGIAGVLTINLNLRSFAPGYGDGRPFPYYHNDWLHKYKGRSWKQKLLDDAIKAFNEIL